jgi:DNA-binding GntR family transcriptional regulator
VLDAIKARDAELAAQVMLDHVLDIESCLFAGNYLQERGDAPA